jgi:hypothetical protein
VWPITQEGSEAHRSKSTLASHCLYWRNIWLSLADVVVEIYLSIPKTRFSQE